MDPSSSTISHRTATGSMPASTVRSTEASVCPALFKTPPSLYFSGKIWPGRLKSPGVESLDARAKTVVALSWADTPVVVPCLASYTWTLNYWNVSNVWETQVYLSISDDSRWKTINRRHKTVEFQDGKPLMWEGKITALGSKEKYLHHI